MPTTLIQADDVFSVTAAIFAIIAFGAWSERTPIGRSISGAMVAILIAAALANFDVLPATSPVYNVVWQYLVPIAIALFLIKADLVSVFTEGGRVLIAFLFGAVGVVIGGVLGVFVLGLGEDGAKYAAIISASMDRGVLPAGQTAPPEIAPYLWGAKTRRIKSLIDAGYKKQLLISNDWIFADTAFATGTLDAMELSNPDGILFVKRRVIPYLKELGVTDDIIDTITVDNPFRFWTVIP